MAIATIKAALKGDIRATEVLLERIEGKVVQKTEGEVRVTRMSDITVDNKPIELEVGGDDETKLT